MKKLLKLAPLAVGGGMAMFSNKIIKKEDVKLQMRRHNIKYRPDDLKETSVFTKGLLRLNELSQKNSKPIIMVAEDLKQIELANQIAEELARRYLDDQLTGRYALKRFLSSEYPPLIFSIDAENEEKLYKEMSRQGYDRLEELSDVPSLFILKNVTNQDIITSFRKVVHEINPNKTIHIIATTLSKNKDMEGTILDLNQIENSSEESNFKP